MLPIGHLSIEKKMRIGYTIGDGEFGQEDSYRFTAYMKNVLDTTISDELSPLAKLYINQKKQDKLFKSASFPHIAQRYRTGSNYLLEISKRYGLDLNITLQVEDTPSNGRGVVIVPEDNPNSVNNTVELNAFELQLNQATYDNIRTDIISRVITNYPQSSAELDSLLETMNSMYESGTSADKLWAEAQKVFDLGETPAYVIPNKDLVSNGN
jgi:hypothetical protein